MHIAPIPDVDSTLAAMSAAARAALLALRDDLVVARGAALDAAAAVPDTTLDWFGPASEGLREAIGRLGVEVEGVHADLEQAVSLLDRAIP